MTRLLVRSALLFACLAPARPTAGQQVHATRPEPESTVMGTVYVFETGMPLAGATVSLVHRTLDGAIGGTYRASSEGHFYFRGVPPGTYSLVVESVGFHTLQDSVRVEAGSDHRLTLQLSPTPVVLEPVVVVVARRTRSIFMDAFDARRQRERGVFLDRMDIERRNAHQVSDLIADVPGAQMVPLRRGGYGVFLRGCRPDVWVDGVRTFDSESASSGIDQFLPTSDLEAIEVYTGMASVPVEFSPASCGAVVIWTRAPDVSEATTGSIWKRSLIAVGMLGVGLFLAR